MLRLFQSLSRQFKYFVAIVLMAIPLYPKFPFIKIPGTFVSIRLEDFLMAFIALVLAINLLPFAKKILAGQIEKAIIIYLSVGLISLVSAIFLSDRVIPHLGVLHWLRRIEYFIPFFLGSSYFLKGKRADFEFFLKILMVVIFISFVYGLGQRHFHWPVIVTQNEEYSKGIALRWIEGSHINSTFAGHYDLATFLVFTLPIFISLFFLVKGKISKAAIIPVFFAGLWLLANAVSRISIVSFLLAGSLSLLIIKKYRAIILFLVVSLIFFSFSTNLWARYSRLIEVTKGKIEKLFMVAGPAYAIESPRRENVSVPRASPAPVFEDRSTSIRLNVEWPRAIRAFLINPFLGTGYSSITLATDNDYLRALGETGLLGLASFIIVFLALINIIIAKVIPAPKGLSTIETSFLTGIAGALPGVFLNAVFIDIFEASKFAIIFWLLSGLAVGLVRQIYK